MTDDLPLTTCGHYRYFFYLSFKGTAYHGWQIQPNGVSVQEVLEHALTTLMRYKVGIVGAGRTDAGVHAKMMVAHADFREPIADTGQLVEKLNRFLPPDIAVSKILSVKPGAHARFDATARTYEYWLCVGKDPFSVETAVPVAGKLNFELMNEAAQCLLRYSDFTSFSKLHTDVKTNICHIKYARWQTCGKAWVFTITANRFLRNMVRAIVGTLFLVGKGRITVEEFCRIIEEKNRCKAGASVPALGLYLTDVSYPDDIFCVK